MNKKKKMSRRNEKEKKEKQGEVNDGEGEGREVKGKKEGRKEENGDVLACPRDHQFDQISFPRTPRPADKQKKNYKTNQAQKRSGWEKNDGSIKIVRGEGTSVKKRSG